MIKRVTYIVIGCVLSLSANLVLAETKIDPYLDIPAKESVVKAASINLSENVSQSSSKIEAFIKTNDVQKTRDLVEILGGHVHTSISNIITTTLDGSSLKEIAASAEVIFIESSKPVTSSNDLAGAEVGDKEVHGGVAGLKSSSSGKGVIVGLIDTGIDYKHPDFLDADGKNRILAIWDQNAVGGIAPAEINDGYGTECDSKMISDGSCMLTDTEGHGTHVAGSLAGSDPVYGGVAPDANIIVVSYNSSMSVDSGYANTFFSSKICQAAYYIFAKAEKLGMPAVINLSLGTHIGPHDGTSLFEQCLSELIKDSAGRAIVAAAGNEYSTDDKYTGLHAGFAVNGIAATNFSIREISNDRIYYIDFWADPMSNLSVGLAIHEGEPSGSPLEYSGLVNAGDSKDGSFLNSGITYRINATETSSPLNGKQHVGLRIVLDKSVNSLSQYTFDLVIKGKGSFNAWMFPDKPKEMIQFTNFSGDHGAGWSFVAGDRKNSIAIPATSPEIIAVSGYVTRNTWDGGSDCCRVNFKLGDILDFSSSGPSAAPEVTGVKPDIAAPGAMIASSLSADISHVNQKIITTDGKHMFMAGTSMATPFVSGTAALMFSINPNFTYADVKHFITETAYTDKLVGAVPNDRWGYGKLDTFSAVEKAEDGKASGNFSSNQSIAQPASGEEPAHTSCALVEIKSNNNEVITCLIMLVPMMAGMFFVRRNNRPISR